MNKINDLVADVNDFWNFLAGDCLAENGITKCWRDRVVNSLIERLCDLAYDLRNLRKMMANLLIKMADAYEKEDNEKYPRDIYAYYNYVNFDCYWRVTNENDIFVIRERVDIYANLITRYASKLLQNASRFNTYGVTVFIEATYYYAVVRRTINEIYNKAVSIASVMVDCMDIYELADKSSATDYDSYVAINSLNIYNNGLKRGNVNSIRNIYSMSVISASSQAEDLKNNAKPIKSLLSLIGEYYDKAKYAKDAKSIIGFAVDNIDAFSKLIEGKDFTFSDGTSLTKTWLSTIGYAMGKTGKKYSNIAGYYPENLNAYLDNMKKSDKYGTISKGFNFAGNIVGAIGTAADYMQGNGKNASDLVEAGFDVAESGTMLSYQATWGTAAAKEFAKSAGGWFTLGKTVTVFGVTLGTELNNYNQDGEITTVEGAKATNRAAITSLTSMTNSLTFNLFNLDAQKIADGYETFADDSSYFAADKLTEQSDASFGDKFGIAVESMWIGMNAKHNDEFGDKLVSNNSVYYSMKNTLLYDQKSTNIKDFNSAVEEIKKVVASPMTDNSSISTEEKLHNWNEKMKDD